MKLTWYGHAAFRVETDDARILIDPFFTGNPSFPEDQRGAAVEGLTHIALTHGHGDHIGDTLQIAEQTVQDLPTRPLSGRVQGPACSHHFAAPCASAFRWIHFHNDTDGHCWRFWPRRH